MRSDPLPRARHRAHARIGPVTPSRARLPAVDVLALLAELGLEPRSFTLIGGYPRWDTGRVTYRVDLADGSTVKVRRVVKTARPTRAAALVRTLADPRLPAPLALSGRVSVERWVDGIPLDCVVVHSTHLCAAADLLADLHRRRSLPDRRFVRTGPVAPLRSRTFEHLDRLLAEGLLDRREHDALAASVERDLPTRAARGVVHGDLCPANLVVTPDGQLVSIDNERVRINFLDHDLARTWTRWPMTPEEEHTFESRYREQGGSLPAQPAQLAWRVCTTVKSASTLRGTPGTGPDTARALLERILTDGAVRP